MADRFLWLLVVVNIIRPEIGPKIEDTGLRCVEPAGILLKLR